MGIFDKLLGKKSKDLPLVIDEYESRPDTYMETIEVMGSKEKALKKAAERGARFVQIRPISIEYKSPEIEYYYSGYDYKGNPIPSQRIIGWTTKWASGYAVHLYR
jgi:hypothetical protein